MKKFKKIIISIMLLICGLLLSSCGSDVYKVKELSKLHPGNEYYYVYKNGITKENKNYYFADLLDEALKEEKVKVYHSFRVNPEIAELEEYVYFSYRYYNIIEKEVEKYVTGYIDLNTLNVTFLKYYNNLTPKVSKIGNKAFFIDDKNIYVYIDKEETKQFNLSDYNFSNAYNDKYLVFIKESNELKQYRIIDKELNEKTFSLDKNANITNIEDNCVIYRINGKYQGFDLESNEELNEAIINEILDNVENIKNSGVVNEKRYKYQILSSYNDENIDKGWVLFRGEDFEKVVSISEVREKVDEVEIVERLYERKLNFKEVFFDNNEIYLSLVYDESFFGFYNGQTLPIVIKYDINNDTFKYVGFYGAVYYELINVIKVK